MIPDTSDLRIVNEDVPEPKRGVVCSISIVCSRCKKNYGDWGMAILEWCWGCGDAICPDCKTQEEKDSSKPLYCTPCVKDPTRTHAYKRAYEREKRMFEIILGHPLD